MADRELPAKSNETLPLSFSATRVPTSEDWARSIQRTHEIVLQEGEGHIPAPTPEQIARAQETALSDGIRSSTWEEIAQAQEIQDARDNARKIRIEAVGGELRVTPLGFDPINPPKDMDDLKS